jgi:hypothetical protein
VPGASTQTVPHHENKKGLIQWGSGGILDTTPYTPFPLFCCNKQKKIRRRADSWT